MNLKPIHRWTYFLFLLLAACQQSPSSTEQRSSQTQHLETPTLSLSVTSGGFRHAFGHTLPVSISYSREAKHRLQIYGYTIGFQGTNGHFKRYALSDIKHQGKTHLSPGEATTLLLPIPSASGRALDIKLETAQLVYEKGKKTKRVALRQSLQLTQAYLKALPLHTSTVKAQPPNEAQEAKARLYYQEATNKLKTTWKQLSDKEKQRRMAILKQQRIPRK